MKILVLNGSPKGDYSVTLQTVRYWEKRFPGHTFEVLHVGARIKALEKDFTPALEALAAADVLLFSYPVYTFIAPCQLHRFIELMKLHNAPVAGKWCTQLSTSKHFYDVTAHRYVEDNCREMGMSGACPPTWRTCPPPGDSRRRIPSGSISAGVWSTTAVSRSLPWPVLMTL